MQKISSSFGRLPLRLVISVVIALIAGWGMYITPVQNTLLANVIVLGLDTERASLLTALLLGLAAAGIGALIGRCRVGSIVGAVLIFSWQYLFPFVQAALVPAFDPGGHLEPLDTGALVYRVITLLSLSIVSAFMGAAIGSALSEVLIDPCILLFRLISTRAIYYKPERAEMERETLRRRFIRTASVGVFFSIILTIVAISASDLFLFVPDIGLHQAPLIANASSALAQKGAISTDRAGGKPFMIYLPPGYNAPANQQRRYPVLYLLHGSPGGIQDWFIGGKAGQSADTLIASGKIQPLIIVAPNGSSTGKAPSEWGNSFDQHQLIENYVSTTVVEYVDQHYRTIADTAHRAIGGLSMGGFGAMNIAIHQPGLFASVISLGGYYLAEGSIWGNNTAYEEANSPLDTIQENKQAWDLHIYLGAATNDQPYYTDTVQFAHILKQLNMNYTLDVQPGRHAWKVWQAQFYRALLWLSW